MGIRVGKDRKKGEKVSKLVPLISDDGGFDQGEMSRGSEIHSDSGSLKTGLTDTADQTVIHRGQMTLQRTST